VAISFVQIVWMVHARAAPPAYVRPRSVGVIHEVDRRRALFTTPIDRVAINQFMLLQSAGLGSRAMGYVKKCKCCVERGHPNKLTN